MDLARSLQLVFLKRGPVRTALVGLCIAATLFTLRDEPLLPRLQAQTTAKVASLSPSPHQVVPVPIFGPKTYVRSQGQPQIIVETINLPSTAVPPFVLKVKNGDSGDNNRVSSASIEVNGVQVAGPSDFNQQVSGFEKPITLTKTSTMTVRLNGAPGGQITITINPGGVTPPVVSIGISPGVGNQAQTLPVTVTGQNTHFVAGTTQLNLGAGITVTNVVVVDPLKLTAQLLIAANAALGPRTVTVTTGAEVAQLPAGFIVNPGVPALVSVTPNQGSQGQSNLSISITGLFTNFDPTKSQVSFGTGIVVSGLVVASKTALTVKLAVAATATPGPRTPTVVTGTEAISLPNGFTVAPGTPVLTQLTPNSGKQGQQNLLVTIQGLYTHFAQGVTTAGFGPGITVASPVTITSATTASVVLNIDPSAIVGPRNVTVTSGAEIVSLPNGFSVTNGTPILTQIAPNNGQQGQQNLSVTISGQFTSFNQSGTTVGLGQGVTVNSISVTSASLLTANVSIAPIATPGTRTVTVTTGTEVVSLANGFTVTAGSPTLTQVNPNSGQMGVQNLQITITGQFTKFVQGTSQVSFGNGINVGSVTVVSPTSLTAVVSISAGATIGARIVTVVSGAEVVSLPNGFTVSAGSPVITSVNPNTGRQGQQNLSINVIGQFTNFVQGTTQFDLGSGIAVTSVTVNSPTNLTAIVGLNPAAVVGPRNLTVSTNTEVVTLNNGFSVIAGTPVILSVNPNSGQQGQQNMSVAVTGQYSHFVQGITTASFGAGVTLVSPLAVVSSTSATAILNIDSAASTGPRIVTLTTGPEVAILSNGFIVTTGTPAVKSINPNSGQQGQQNLSVAVDGQFTHFAQGATQVSFGQDVIVESVTVSSATALTARITIPIGASTGARTVSLTTGAEFVSIANGFSIQAQCLSGKEAGVRIAYGPTGALDATAALDPNITVLPGGNLRMYYTGCDASANCRILSATSTDGFTWVKEPGIRIDIGLDALNYASRPNVVQMANGSLRMYYVGKSDSFRILSATSNDGLLWIKEAGRRIDTGGPFGCVNVSGPEIDRLQSGFRMYYGCSSSASNEWGTILSATSSDGLTWINENGVRLAPPTGTLYREMAIRNLPNGTKRMYFGNSFDGAIASAVSSDGLAWTPEPGIRIDRGAPGSLDERFTLGPDVVSVGDGTFRIFYSGARPLGAIPGGEFSQILSARFCTLDVNNPPTVRAGQNRTIVLPQNSVSLSGMASDDGLPQGSTLSYAWSAISGTATVTFSNANALSTTATFGVPGDYTLRLIASDSDQLTGDTLSVAVRPASPQLTVVAPNTAQQGQQGLSVNITGQNTHFTQGTTTADFGAGISVVSLTVSSSIAAIAVLNIGSQANIGPRNVALRTGAEVATLANGFTVLQPTNLVPIVSAGAPQTVMLPNAVGLAGTVSDDGLPLGGPLTGGWAVANAPVSTGSQFWLKLAPSGNIPSPRNQSSSVYDSATNRLIVFGGLNQINGAFNDVWVLAGANGLNADPSWIQLQPSGTPPSPRYGHGAFYDPTSNRMVVVFGATGPSGLLNEVWVLTNANGTGGTPTWTRLATSGTLPSPRCYMGLAYDSVTNRIIIFGGVTSATTQNAETWVLSNANGTEAAPSTWTQLALVGNVPDNRASSFVAFDSSANRLIVFGGQVAQNNNVIRAFNDSWTLTNANGLGGSPVWIQLIPDGALTSPTRRFEGGSVAYNSQNKVLTISGGLGNCTGVAQCSDFSDVWSLSNANGIGGSSVWTQRSPIGGPPAPIGYAAYDRPRDRLISFGGGGNYRSPVVFYNDVWVLSNATGSDTGGIPGTVTFSNPTFSSPNISGQVVPIATKAAFSLPGEYTIRLSGNDSQLSSSANLIVTVTPPAGIPVVTSAVPSAGQQGQTGLAVTITGQNTLFTQGAVQVSFGNGISAGSIAVVDSTHLLCTLNITSGATLGFHDVTVTTGSQVLTLANGFIVLAGTPVLTQLSPANGSQGQGNLAVAISSQFTHFLQGTTAASFGAGVTVASLTINSATSATALITIDQAAALGARNVALTTGSEVVTLVNGFSILAGNRSPIVSAGANQTITLPNGATLTGTINDDGLPIGSLLSANWSVTSAPSTGSQSWIRNNPSGSLPAASQDTAGIQYDPVTNTLIVFGGSTNSPSNDVWILPGANGLGGGTSSWVRLNPTGTLPLPRYAQSSFYDPGTNRLVIYGGIGPSYPQTTNDLWVLTNANGTGGTPAWIRLEPSGTLPTARFNSSVSYDASSNRMMVFGGSIWAQSRTFYYQTNETWVLTNANGTGSAPPTWISTTPVTHLPVGREVPVVAYDSKSNRLIAFGGASPYTPLGEVVYRFFNDSWVLTNANGLTGPSEWIQIIPDGTSTSPARRGAGPSAYNATNNSLTITTGFGNCVVSPFSCTYFSDVWSLTNANGIGGSSIWTQSSPTGGPVAVPFFGHAGYDHANDRLIGLRGTENATWVLTNATNSVPAGQGTVTFGSPSFSTPNVSGQVFPVGTTANFSAPGTYVLRVTGTDSQLASTSDVTVTVLAGTTIPALTSILPNTGQQGRTNLLVVINGINTHFVQGSSQVSFGAGITMNSVAVSSPTSLTANISIAVAATTGPRGVMVTTGGEVVQLANAFTITPGSPIILSANPNAGQQGQQNLSVAITGQFTHFNQGTTTANFGTGILVASLTVTSPTNATVFLSIDSTATLGARQVSITTGVEVASLVNGFTVVQGNRAPVSVNDTITVDAQPAGPEVVDPAYEIERFAIVPLPTSLAVPPQGGAFGDYLYVSSGMNAPLGPDVIYRINLSNGKLEQFFQLPDESDPVSMKFGIGPPYTTNLYISSNNRDTASGISDGQDYGGSIVFLEADPSIRGEQFLTHRPPPGGLSEPGTIAFTTGNQFGTNMLVSNLNDVPYAVMQVAPNGQSSVFSPLLGPTSYNGLGIAFPLDIRFGSSVYTTYPPNRILTVSPSGATNLFSEIGEAIEIGSISFAPTGAYGGDAFLAATKRTPPTNKVSIYRMRSDGTYVEFVRNLPGGNYNGTTYPLNDGIAFTSDGSSMFIVDYGSNAVFKVTAKPTITGNVLSNDNDPDGNPISAALVSGPTNGTLRLNSDGSFFYSPRAGYAGTDSFTYRANDGLADSNLATVTITIRPTVANQPPTPNAGPDRTVTLPGTVNLSGSASDDGLPSGSAVAYEWTQVGGPGTASFSNKNSPTTTASFSAPGTYYIRLLVNDSDLYYWDDVTITVLAGSISPSITSVAPNSGLQGQSLTVSITGLNTHFAQGFTTVNFGVGITVNAVYVTCVTCINAQITVAANAAFGGRSITVTTGAEVATLSGGFSVTSTGPVLTLISPTTGQQGQQNLSIAITGQNTHFVQGTTTASFGTGISVTSLSVLDTSHIVAIVSIDASAAVGGRTLTVSTGGEQISLENSFVVSACASGKEPGVRIPQVVMGDILTLSNGSLRLYTTVYGGANDVVSFSSTDRLTWVQDPGIRLPISSFERIGVTQVLQLGNNSYRMYFGGRTSGTYRIYSAFSSDSLAFTLEPGIRMDVPSGCTHADTPDVERLGNGQFRMYFACGSSLGTSAGNILSATSPDGLFWTQESGVRLTGAAGIDTLIFDPRIERLPGGSMRMYYTATTQIAAPEQIFSAVSADGLQWTKEPGVRLQHGSEGSLDYRAFSPRFIPLPDGTHRMFYQGNDPSSSGPQGANYLSARFCVVGSNNPPSVVAGPAQTIVAPLNSAVLGGLVSDDGVPTGASLSYSWTQVSGPAPVVFSNGQALSTTATFPTFGTYVLRLTAYDSGLYGFDDVTITYLAQASPSLVSIAPNNAALGTALAVMLTGSGTQFSGNSVIDFGPGIAVSSLSVIKPTRAIASVVVSPSAAIGPRNVTVSTQSQVVSLANGFTVAPAVSVPALVSVIPGSGQRGQQNIQVVVTGQNTHFTQGSTTATFGSDITIVAVNVSSQSSATVVLAIGAAAIPGLRPVTLTTGSEVVSLPNGFEVVEPAIQPSVSSVSPNSGTQGLSGPIAIVGLNTHFVQGVSTLNMGPGITINSLSVTCATCLTAQITIADTASVGQRNVTVTTGSEVATLTAGFTVIAGTPILTSFTPTSAQQGQTFTLSLTGRFTHFAQGTTQVSLGSGTTASNIVVGSATSLTAQITVDPAASLGTRTLTVTTGTETASVPGVFNVVAALPVLVSLNPGGAKQGQLGVGVTIAGLNTHFAQGTTQPNFGAGVTVVSVTVTSPIAASAVLNIDSAAAIGARNVTVTTGTETVTFTGGFTIAAGDPVISQVSPISGQAGQQGLSIGITGQFTHFVQGTTQATFGPGVTVVSLTVASPTTATAVVNIDPAAATGPRTVTLTTGTEVATLLNGFAVSTGPALTVISPGGGTQGLQNLAVTITAVNSHFVQGTTQVAFSGTGITVNSVTVASPTSVTANVSIAASATVGNRVITVTTASEVVSAPDAFTILAGIPILVSVAPASGAQAQQNLAVTITGAFTHFAQGVSQVSFSGTAITVNSVSVATATSLTANISIAANASAAPRAVTVTTGSEVASLSNGFTVNPGINQAPFITINPTWSVTLPNRLIVTYTVTDDFLPAGGALTVSWEILSGPGNVGFLDQQLTSTSVGFDQPGTYQLRITATDTSLTVSRDITVTVNPAPAPPTVSITSPADSSDITTQTNVTGTVTSASLSSWILEFRMADDSLYRTIATGTTQITNGVLGVLDPTLQLNGIGYLRLRATDSAGQSATAGPVTVLLAKNQKIGHFTVSFKDLEVPLSGIGIQLIRTYDSRNLAPSDFGVGWTLDIRNVRLRDNGAMGLNWQGTVTGTGLSRTYCLQPTQNHIVNIVLSDGTAYKFAPTLTTSCQALAPILQSSIRFQQLSGPAARLTLTDTPTVVTQGGDWPGPQPLLDEDTLQPVDYERYLLTFPDGRTLTVSRAFGLERLTDLNSNSITITSAGITHSSGKSITFLRDGQGRITTVTDPSGRTMTYAYDATSNLTSFTDQANNASTYTYDPNHRLLTIRDPRGIEPIRNEYDASGRLISQRDAFGNPITYTHDFANRREVVTDRLGNSTINEYDADGNVVRVTDPLLGVTQRTYDSHGNTLTETSPIGATRAYTYDANDNRLTETDPLGNVTRYSYTALNRVATITDALNRVTTNTYDANGNLLTTTDASGTRTTVFDSRGNPVSTTDQAGRTTTSSFDNFGNMTSQADPMGRTVTYVYDLNGRRTSESRTRTTSAGTETLVTSYVYDSAGRLTQTTHADGTTSQVAYNSIGKQSSTTDQFGRQTSYVYDNMGRLTRTNFPDGTNEQSTYDAEGRRLTSIDRGGRTTSYVYDKLGRLTTTTYADGATNSTVYDAAGQVSRTIDARGNATNFGYDLAGRRNNVTNALSQITGFEYDSVGNQTAMTDARGNRTQFQYDAMNRRTVVTYPNSTTDQVGYDAVGRTVSKTDQAGRITQFGYDPLGRLIRVTDALNQNTTYAYDEVGNRISQTDARGRITRFEYDRMGRRTRRTLPLLRSETMAYDAAGNLRTKTDFNGRVTTYTYDAANRLLTKVPDAFFSAPPVIFTYTATGQRFSMSDPSGVTNYVYDSRDRLTQKSTPQGTLNYTYDLQGNLTGITSSNIGGTSVTYAHDALNRLWRVTDNRLQPNGVTTYAYDAAGNLESYLYPNGVQHTYTYSPLNRLTNLAVARGATTLASYGYTLGASGNRTRVLEFGGRTVDYTYDSIYRLTGETVAGGSVNGAAGYTYDQVGNRLTRTSSLTPVPAATYGYDDNDRLASDTYDANGNTLTAGGVIYTYDFENRLKTKNGNEVTIVYDGDGNRVSKTVIGVTTRYLVDDRNLTGYAQVLEESTNIVQRVYTHGLNRISQSQTGGTSFYGYDGQGSVRLLTDASGTITDRYTYDAFGTVVESSGATPNDYQYVGEQHDSNLDLTYLRNRYLRTASGRFWTMDLSSGNPQVPLSLNQYIYANGNPILNIDPLGMEAGAIGGGGTLIDALAASAIVGILSTNFNQIHWPMRFSKSGNGQQSGQPCPSEGIHLPVSFGFRLSSTGAPTPRIQDNLVELSVGSPEKGGGSYPCHVNCTIKAPPYLNDDDKGGGNLNINYHISYDGSTYRANVLTNVGAIGAAYSGGVPLGPLSVGAAAIMSAIAGPQFLLYTSPIAQIIPPRAAVIPVLFTALTFNLELLRKYAK